MRTSTHFSLSWLTLVLLPTISWAQNETELDEITVKSKLIPQNQLYSANSGNVATKVSTPLIRTPVSVTVVTEKQIQDRNAINVAESLSYTSGLVSNYRGQNNELEIMVRGIGNKSDGGGVPTYLNGIAYQGSYELDPFFLESINVIKGPASVLYGQSNPGGIVDIVTKKPTQTDKNLLQLKIGNNDYYQLGLDIDRKLNEQLAFRLIGNIKRLNWKEHYVRQQDGTLAPSLTWKPDENTEWTLYAFYQKRPKAGDRNFLLRDGTLEPVNGSKVPYDFFISDPNFHKLSLEQWIAGSQFSHQFNDTFTFRQNLRYNKSESILHNLVAWDPIPGKTEIARRARIFEDRWYEFGVDNQLESRFSTGNFNHKLLSGLEYKQTRYDLQAYLSRNSYNIDWNNPVYGLRVDIPPLSNNELKTLKQTGIYLQDQIEYDNLDLLFGVRYDHTKNRYIDRLSDSKLKMNDNKVTWRAGAIYNFANGIAPYLSYSTSFQPEVGVDGNNNPLNPTTAEQYEIGFKYQPIETVLFSTALFRINQKNLVTRDPQTYAKTQTGETRTQGLESSLAANLNQNLSLIASYAYTHREVKKDKDSSLIGKTPWGIPRHQGSLWAKYTWTTGWLNGFSLGAGVRYMGTTQGDARNTFTVPHYTLYDASAGYDLGKTAPSLKGASVQLNIQNLSDKKYVASCANAYSCFYGTERTVTLTFNYEW